MIFHQKVNVQNKSPILLNLEYAISKAYSADTIPILDPDMVKPDEEPAPYITYSWKDGQMLTIDSKIWDSYNVTIMYYFAPPSDNLFLGLDKKGHGSIRDAYLYQRRQELNNIIYWFCCRKNPMSHLYQRQIGSNQPKRSPFHFLINQPLRGMFKTAGGQFTSADTAKNWMVSQTISFSLLNKKMSEVC